MAKLFKILNDPATIDRVWMGKSEENNMDLMVVYERVFDETPKQNITTSFTPVYAAGNVTKWERIGHSLEEIIWHCYVKNEKLRLAMIEFYASLENNKLFMFGGKTYEWKKIPGNMTLLNVIWSKKYKKGRFYPITLPVCKNLLKINVKHIMNVPKRHRSRMPPRCLFTNGAPKLNDYIIF